MIRPVLEEGPAPAAAAAVLLTAGTFLGAWSVCGLAEAAVLMTVSATGLACVRGRRVRGLAFAAFWLGAGFVSGRARIAVPAAEATRIFAALDEDRTSADVVEGTLADFWSGEAPRARSTLRAGRLAVSGAWRDFPAEVVIYVSGQSPVEDLADRGTLVRLTGRLEPEDLPASDRDIRLPWPRYRLSVKSARMIDPRAGTLESVLTAPNRWLFRRLAAHRPDDTGFDRNVRGPLAALLLGRTAELDRGMVARYRRGGLYHLLVISGLHVVLAVGLARMLLAATPLHGKGRDVAMLVFVSAFVLIGGANPPAVRAGLVVAVLLTTRLCERPIVAAQATGLSALAIVLAAPAQVFSIGAILTFAAVCGIALFFRPIRARLPPRPDWAFSGLAAGMSAQAATAPILFWRFNVVAAGAWLTTPVAVPLAGALIAVGAALLLCAAAGIPALPLAALFGFGSRCLETLADRAAGAAFLRPTPPLLAILLLEALILLAAFSTRRRRAAVGAAAAGLYLALALRDGPRGPRRGFSVEALDVGQGDAILVRWMDRAILVDGGGPFDRVSTDFGRTRLVPKLLDRGVTRLDAVVLTHPHPDHALGLFAVLEDLPVGVFARSSGEDEGDLFASLDGVASRRGIPVRVLQAGDAFEAAGARFQVLHSGGRAPKTDAVNNQSVIAAFERDGRSALLTGDAGRPAEAELLEAGQLRPADLLKVGHHGSRTATSSELVAALRPRLALISCGRRNRFGHPVPETLGTLRAACVRILRTDLRSDCRVELSPDATRLTWRGTEQP